MIGPARPPASCSRAASSCAGDLASITPSTASARVRSIRPVRKARSVNSPGSASLAPRVRQCASSRSSSGGEPTVWISTSGPPVYVLGPGQSAIDAGSIGLRPSTANRPVRRSARVGRRRIAIGHEARQGDPPGLRPGQADQAAESRAGGAGHRRDRVGRVEVTHRRPRSWIRLVGCEPEGESAALHFSAGRRCPEGAAEGSGFCDRLPPEDGLASRPDPSSGRPGHLLPAGEEKRTGLVTVEHALAPTSWPSPGLALIPVLVRVLGVLAVGPVLGRLLEQLLQAFGQPAAGLVRGSVARRALPCLRPPREDSSRRRRLRSPGSDFVILGRISRSPIDQRLLMMK